MTNPISRAFRRRKEKKAKKQEQQAEPSVSNPAEGLSAVEAAPATEAAVNPTTGSGLENTVSAEASTTDAFTSDSSSTDTVPESFPAHPPSPLPMKAMAENNDHDGPEKLDENTGKVDEEEGLDDEIVIGDAVTSNSSSTDTVPESFPALPPSPPPVKAVAENNDHDGPDKLDENTWKVDDENVLDDEIVIGDDVTGDEDFLLIMHPARGLTAKEFAEQRKTEGAEKAKNKAQEAKHQVAAGLLNAAKKDQLALYFEENYSDLFSTSRHGEDIKTHDDMISARNLGRNYDATFFDPVTLGLLHPDKVLGKLGLKIEHHMTHIKLYIYDKREQDTIGKEMALTIADREKQGAEAGKNLDTGSMECVTVADNNDIGQDPTEEDAEDRVTKIFAFVNFEASKSIRVVPCDKASHERLPETARKQLAELPEQLRAVITGIEKRNLRPILVEMAINFEYVATERFHLQVPVFARAFVETIKEGRIAAIIAGHEKTPQQFKYLAECFQFQKNGHNPLNNWMAPGQRFVYSLDRMFTSPRSGVPTADYKYQVKYGYHSRDEAFTVVAAGIAQEYAILRTKTSKYEGRELTLRLVEIAGTQGQSFVGFLPLPEEDELRLEPDTVLDIIFPDSKRYKPNEVKVEEGEEDAKQKKIKTEEYESDEEQQSDESDDAYEKRQRHKSKLKNAKTRKEAKTKPRFDGTWRAKVAPPMSFCPADMVPLFIYRAWDKEQGMWDKREVKVACALEAKELELPDLIAASTGQPIRVQIVESDKTFNQNMAAMDIFAHTPKNRQHVPWNGWMEGLFVAKDFDKMTNGDVLTAIRHEFPEPEKLMKLNDEQYGAIIFAQKAMNHTLLIAGPPGTGKSYLIGQMMIPYFMAKEIHLVLITSPSNTAADSLARDIKEQLDDMQKEKSVPAGRYIIRLYSKTAEQQIRFREVQQHMPRDPKARPLVEALDDTARQALDEVQLLLRTQYDLSTKQKYIGVTDKRVQNLEHSCGYRMLVVAGIINPSEQAPDDKWSDFRTLYLQRLDPEHPLDKEQVEQFDKATNALFDHIIQNASAVICTTFTGGSPKLQRAAGPKVSLVIIDEFAHEREDNLIPIFAAEFPNVHGLIGVGDHLQLGPTVTLTGKEVAYAPALGTSLFARLIKQGFPVHQLVLQNRMLPQISKIPNDLVYKGILINGAKTVLRKRVNAGKFKGFVKRQFALKDTNVVFLDVGKGKSNSTEFGSGKSRYNELYVTIVANQLKELLKMGGATVAILTPYVAQRNCYLTVKAAMVAAHVPGVDRLHVDTFDGSQGDQFDYVIMDMPATSQSAGFLTDPRRVNVALTRAKNGLIVVGSSFLIDKMKGRIGYLRELFRVLGGTRTRLGVQVAFDGKKGEATYPTCEFYTPGRRVLAWTSMIPISEPSIFAKAKVDEASTVKKEAVVPNAVPVARPTTKKTVSTDAASPDTAPTAPDATPDVALIDNDAVPAASKEESEKMHSDVPWRWETATANAPESGW